MELGGYYDRYAHETSLFAMVTTLSDEIKNRELCGTAHFIDNQEREGGLWA